MGQEDSIREIARSIRENPGCFLLFTPSAAAACMEDENAGAGFVHCRAVMMGADQVSQSLTHRVQKAPGPEGKGINLCGTSDVGPVRVSATEKREDDARAEGEILLPPELKELAGQDGIEAIYPLDHITAHLAFLEEIGSAHSSGALYYNLRADLKRSLSKSEIEQRAAALTRRHPVLRSFFIRDKAGKQWQVFRKEGDAPVWYRDLSKMGKEARERFFSGFFQVMNETKAPFQVGCFQTGADSCTLLLRLVHTQADGMSYVILLNELAGDIPEGQDAFYAYREKRLRSRSRFPKELQEYYRQFGDLCRLPVTATAGKRKADVRNIVLTGEQTDRLQEQCGKKRLTLSGYAEYCFGCGLLRVLGRESVWFSHVYSGRDETFAGSENIVGNMICVLPVRIREGMSAEAFQKALLVPWKYPYVTDTEEYRRLNMHEIEWGVVSRIFPPFHKNILSFRDYPIAFQWGHYLELKEGQLEIVLRCPAGEKEKHNLDILEDTVRKLLLQGP